MRLSALIFRKTLQLRNWFFVCDTSRDIPGVWYSSCGTGVNTMDLAYAYKLLLAVDQQRHGFLKIRGRKADREVRLMDEAGLVNASFGVGKDKSFIAIKCLTDAGHAFLRVFKDLPIPAAPRVKRIKRMAGEWNLNPQKRRSQ